jgi:hypothetical protein
MLAKPSDPSAAASSDPASPAVKSSPDSDADGENDGDKAPSKPAKSAKATYSDRVLSQGASRFSVTLPCAPKADSPDKDDTDVGPMVSTVSTCDYEAGMMSFTIMASRFEKTVPDANRNAKSAAVAKLVAKELCEQLKGKSCKFGTPIVSSGVADLSFDVPGDPPTTFHVAARYPLAVAVGVVGDATSDDAKKVLASIKITDAK